MERLVEQAKAGEVEDAAHFVMQPFLGYLYLLAVRYIKVSSGRQRFSVLGALNAVTKEVITFTDHGYINALSVYELLDKLHEQRRRLRQVVIMDNARYQRCALVTEKAFELSIQIVFLPPYSPNLNLIERLWKFVKKKVLYNQHYPKYEQFHQAISKYLKQTDTTYKEDLDTLLIANFQPFKNVIIQPS